MTSETPNPIDVHVGQRVRLRRKQRGLSQGRLADALGLTFQQIQKYERGTNRVSASKLYGIAMVLGVPVGFFYEGLDDPSSPVSQMVKGFQLAEGLPLVAGRTYAEDSLVWVGWWLGPLAMLA